MPDAGTAAAPKPAAAPGFGECLEQSLRAFAVAPSVFAAAALRPAPSLGVVLGLTLAGGSTALALALLSDLGFAARVSAAMTAVLAAAALAVYASLLLLAALLLYGLGRALGGAGDFDRALQAAAALSLLAPLQALCNWLPQAWPAPTLLAAWVAAGALEGLFKAKPLAARAACSLLAAGALCVQFAGRVFVERAAQTYAARRDMAAAVMSNADISRRIQAVSEQAAPVPAAPAGAVLGLDLLRGPAGEDAPSAQGEAPAPPAQRQAAALNRSAIGMLDAVTPLLSSVALNKNMSAQQKADMKELQDLLQEMRSQMSSPVRSLSDQEQARRMAKIQQLTLRLMAAGAAGLQPAPPNSEGRKR